ncbi:unnamed protein product [Phaedon cochleariae]|uniref:Uncharacterized protein n=1 Tax=Phaedon cochleariae TaxID=80249 RepID=A0A9N9SL63_PHACE|nr:unnamed protein product [Phaedon cochleariae]
MNRKTGHRAQFLSHWAKWKASIEASMHSAPTYLPSPNMEPSKSMENTDECTSELMHHDSSHHDTRNALLKLLNEANDGKALLAEEKTRGCLSSKERSTLCKLIIRRELQGNPTKRISGERLLATNVVIKINHYFMFFVHHIHSEQIIQCFFNKQILSWDILNIIFLYPTYIRSDYSVQCVLNYGNITYNILL